MRTHRLSPSWRSYTPAKGLPPRARNLDNNKREGSIESEEGGELATHRSMFQSCRWTNPCVTCACERASSECARVGKDASRDWGE
jgi:hypothetical protein